MIAARLTPRDRAKLYLAVADALGVPESEMIKTQRYRARSEYALALSGETDSVNMWAALALADEITYATGGWDLRVKASTVAEAYGVEIGTARRALKLSGWVQGLARDEWLSEPGARNEWTPDPEDDWSEPTE